MDTLIPLPRDNHPPTEHEQAFIRSLVTKEQEALDFLKQKQEYAESRTQQARDVVNKRNTILSKAEARLSLAKQLAQALEECVKVVSAVGNVYHAPVPIPVPVPTGEHIPRTHRILQQRDSAVKQLRLKVEEAQVAIREESDAVMVAQEELQGALAAEHFSSLELKMWADQMSQINTLLEPMLNRIRAIWRVSDDIWTRIFQFITDCSFDMWDEGAWADAVSANGPWYQRIALLGVCQRWRRLLCAIPTIWENPLLFMGGKNNWSEASLNFHLKQADGRLGQLTIISQMAGDMLSDSIKTILGQIRFAQSLRCDYTEIDPALAQTWWDFYPPIQELYITHFKQGSDMELPSRLCVSIKKVVTKHFLMTFQDATPSLEELRLLEPSTRHHNLASLAEVRQVLKANGATLRLLEVTGKFRESESGENNDLEEVSLGELQEVSMTLGTLVNLVGLKCRLPNLRKIRVLSPVDLSIDSWHQFLSVAGRSSTIQAISIGTMDPDEVAKLDPFIGALKRKDLALHDENGEFIMIRPVANRGGGLKNKLLKKSSFVTRIRRFI